MNHVLLATFHRGGQCLTAGGPPTVFSALSILGRTWLSRASTTNLDGTNGLRLPYYNAKEPRRAVSTRCLRHATIRKDSPASLITKAPFHSSTVYFKAKRPSQLPAKKSARAVPASPSLRVPPPGSIAACEVQKLQPGSRYNRNTKLHQPHQDLNPSGKPIYAGSEEWDNCIKNVTLDPPPTLKHIEEIFGGAVRPIEEASKILKVLQYQRLSGTLDHGISLPSLTDNLIANAVEFLRKKYSVDEDAAIMARIEREYDAENSELDKIDGKPAYIPQQSAEETGIYGKSGRDSIIAEKKAAQEHEAAEKAKQDAEKGGEAATPVVRKTFRERALEVRQRESAEWVKRYKEKALLSQGPPPDMSIRQRLLPSAIFTLIVVACCLAFATYYVPPPRSARLFPDTPPAAATVLTLIGINVAVFVAWHIPPFWRFMNQHFILVVGRPTATSLLGGTFSHHHFTHLVANMVGLWMVGTWLHDDIGRGNFLATYIAGGVCTSMVALTAFVVAGKFNLSSLGASGIWFALVAARCVLHTGDDFKVPFLPADSEVRCMPLLLLGCFFLVEILALRRRAHAVDSAVDRLSHVAGLCVGSIIGVLLHYKMHVLEKREVERPFSDKAVNPVTEKGDETSNYNVTVSKPIDAQSRPQPQLQAQSQPMKWEGRKGW